MENKWCYFNEYERCFSVDLVKHTPACYMAGIDICPSNFSLHGEPIDKHWFSGWPGAFCLKCKAEDVTELCLGDSCKCQCHEEFWKEYDKQNNRKNKN